MTFAAEVKGLAIAIEPGIIFIADCVDDITNALIVQKKVNKLRDL